MYLTLVEQALKKLSVEELCAQLKDMDLVHCARVFQEEDMNGKDLLELSSAREVASILNDYGEIVNDSGFSLLACTQMRPRRKRERNRGN